jgi:hypothetical protein
MRMEILTGRGEERNEIVNTLSGLVTRLKSRVDYETDGRRIGYPQPVHRSFVETGLSTYPELIMLPRNRAAAAAWWMQTVYDLLPAD